MKIIRNLYGLTIKYAPYLLVIWVILIIVFSSLPNLPRVSLRAAGEVYRLDYLLHFMEYTGLTILALFTFSPTCLASLERRVLITAALLMLFALIDESHQLLIPNRSFNIIDLLCDACGIITGLFLTPWMNRKMLPV